VQDSLKDDPNVPVEILKQAGLPVPSADKKDDEKEGEQRQR
jgi:hypothetical protein